MAPNLIPGLETPPWIYVQCLLVRGMWVDGQQDDAGVEGLTLGYPNHPTFDAKYLTYPLQSQFFLVTKKQGLTTLNFSDQV
jgi:antirestriction protein